MQDTATLSTAKPRAGIEGLDVYRVAVEFYRLLRQFTQGRRGHNAGVQMSELLRQVRAELFGHSWVLEHQCALHIAITVQA